jgi:hypothetical protein
VKTHLKHGNANKLSKIQAFETMFATKNSKIIRFGHYFEFFCEYFVFANAEYTKILFLYARAKVLIGIDYLLNQ